MEVNKFLFCPQCGSKNILTEKNGYKWKCPDCNFDLYCNVASAVGLLIINSKNELLFEIRAKEPRKGYLAFPGGFTNMDESGEDAALRECLEETGICPLSVDYLCSFPNTYEYKNIVYKTCDMFFTAVLPPNSKFNLQKSEVTDIVWKKIETKEDINNLPLAFESAKKTLLTWIGIK